MSLTLQPVASRRDLRRFVTFPWQIYRDDPCWVPPLIAGQEDKLTPGRDAFWEHAERMLWLALMDGRPAGTIAAIIDHGANQALSARVGQFGFFECVNDPAVAGLLLDAAADWLRARGMTVMRGPYSPGGLDNAGLLVEGHDTRPSLLEAHTPPYYVALVEGAGLTKDTESVAWLVRAAPEARDVTEVFPARLVRVAERVRSHGNVRIRQVNLAAWDADVALAGRLYNASLSTLPDYVPIPESEFRAFAASFRAFLEPSAALLVEVDGRPAGFALALPDMNAALRYAKGRLWPCGLFKIWWHSRRLTRATFKILMVLPEYRGRGLEALLILEAARGLLAHGYREADLSLTGEENENMLRLMAGLGFQVYRRYRVYRRELTRGGR